MELRDFFAKIPDDDMEGICLGFRASLQKAPFWIDVHIREPTNPQEMRAYMIKVQHALILIGETRKTVRPIEIPLKT